MSEPGRGSGVVITGAGAICALGDSPAAIHDALLGGCRGFAPPSVFDADLAGGREVAEVKGFAPQHYLGARNVRPLDRTGRLAAVASGLALAEAGRPSVDSGGHPIGLVLGTMFSGVRTIGEFDRRAQSAGPEYASPLDFSNTVLNAAAGQVAIWHRLAGVNSTIAAGAVSGVQAIGYAAELIHDGRASMLVAGGVEELCFESFQGFLGAGLLAPAGAPSVPFDRSRSGVTLGEAAAFFVLENEHDARARGARVLGRIAGSATAFDPEALRGRGMNGDALAGAIDRALAAAGTSPARIAAVAASASGSRVLDLAEAHGIHAALGSRTPVTAPKSMVGETLGASGALNAVVALESLRARRLPGVAGLAERDPAIDIAVSASETPLSGAAALVTAIDREGNCGALVLEVAA